MTRQQPHYPQPWIDSHMFSILSLPLSKSHSLAHTHKNIHSILHLIHHVMIPFAFSSFDASTHRLSYPPPTFVSPHQARTHSKILCFPFSRLSMAYLYLYTKAIFFTFSSNAHAHTHTHTMHIKILTGSMLCFFSAGWKDKYSFT